MLNSRSPTPENDVFAFGTELVPERERQSPSTTSHDFDGLLSPPLHLHEDLKDGCGGQLWPAGMVLARYMLKYHHTLNQARIVEIGAGGGLVGLAVARGCKLDPRTKLVISDQVPMLALMEKNIKVNQLENQVEAVVYNWGSSAPSQILAPPESLGYPSIVLAADCVYFEPAFPLLLSTLHDLIGPKTTCYFCFKKRRKADMRFVRDIVKAFDASLIAYDRAEQDHREGIFLYQVVRRKT